MPKQISYVLTDEELERRRLIPRNSKWSPARAKRIVSALSSGNTRRAAAAAGSISTDTFYRWLERKPKFAAQVQEAEALAERAHVANVNLQARQGNLDASKFWLERRRPADWGRVDRVELLVRQEQAEMLARQLREEQGIDITPQELVSRYNSLAQKALPAGTKSGK